jgi:O-antigen/teichoic acid export membrane protein
MLAQLVCVPLYLRFMGIEAYALIGFYMMFQAMAQIMDLGLSPTMSREMARYSVQPEKAAEARDLLRTVETGYWIIGIALGAILILASPWVATHWIHATALSHGTVQQALLLMGVLAIFQWPVSLYHGGLMGLHRQVSFNILRIAVITLNTGGAVLILWLVSPTVQAFLCWQILVGAAQSVVLSILLRKYLPVSPRPSRFNFLLLNNIGRFAAGMGAIAITSLILTQVDKLVVSKLLSLKTFGYYTVAWAVAGSLAMVSGVVFNVIFPRMSAQVAGQDQIALKHSYHLGAQLMAVLVLPPAAVLSFFSFDVLRLWTRNIEMSLFVAPILRVLVLGSALNALLALPFALQLASGWTRLSWVAGLLSIGVVVPVIIPMTKYYGPVGAATVWVGLNAVNMLIAVPIMHRRLLPHDMGGYFRDIGFPFLAALGVAGIARLAFANLNSPVSIFFALLTVGFASLATAALAAPIIRLAIQSSAAAAITIAKVQYSK